MTQGTLKIHSENILPIIKKWLYTDRDIFLRELVSNACDAMSKLKILRDQGEVEFKDEELRIDIEIDKEKKTIKIIDIKGVAKDELHERLRGPAKNITVLATGFSDVGEKATNRHEPLLMTVDYGKGRTFHSTLGHMDYSMECVGFITTFQRGAEWAATGSVTQKIPKNFPSADAISIRKFDK